MWRTFDVTDRAVFFNACAVVGIAGSHAHSGGAGGDDQRHGRFRIERRGASAAFGTLANGDRASVRGMKDGSLVRASQIDAQPGPSAPPTPDPTPAPDVTLNGAIAGLSGACPSLTMTVAGGAVKTN